VWCAVAGHAASDGPPLDGPPRDAHLLPLHGPQRYGLTTAAAATVESARTDDGCAASETARTDDGCAASETARTDDGCAVETSCFPALLCLFPEGVEGSVAPRWSTGAGAACVSSGGSGSKCVPFAQRVLVAVARFTFHARGR
jgi:hypothetical protein